MAVPLGRDEPLRVVPRVPLLPRLNGWYLRLVLQATGWKSARMTVGYSNGITMHSRVFEGPIRLTLFLLSPSSQLVIFIDKPGGSSRKFPYSGFHRHAYL